MTTPVEYFSCQKRGPTKALYKCARDHFRKTCKTETIVSIELCVNEMKWESFCVKKSMLDRGLKKSGLNAASRKRGANEQHVFHGTDAETIKKICVTGFNRSYSSAKVYGHGTYFARDARYSANPRYAKADSRGIQQMLLCRILAGEPCIGDSSMVQPSSKASGVLHESMVDDVANPTIFVLSAGSDDCAYPEFRITFT